ncbi:cytochrome P450 [Streptomyces sp. NPDC014861]|uniref:cytochrome P450 n=1 Tax=Streptomyces sp. NPDC014861 TaxID=3364923 RepID=UPI0037034375
MTISPEAVEAAAARGSGVTVADVPRLDPEPPYVPVAERSAGGLPQVKLPSGHPVVHLTRYADVHKVLTDSTFGRAETNVEGGPTFFPTPLPPEMLINLDGPDHSRMRRFVTADYSANAVARLAPFLDEVVTRRFAELRAQERPDLYTAVLDPIPIEVTCRFLGIPEEDAAYFRPHSPTIQKALHDDVPALMDEFFTSYGYVTDLVTGKRPVVPGGLIEGFLAGRDEATPPLEDKELVGLVFAAMVAIDQNVLSVLAKAALVLLTADSLWQRAVEDPDVVPQLVEEVIRLVPLGSMSTFPRVAHREVVTSEGTIFPGDVVYADAFAANRDPSVYENPLVIDPDRKGKRHLQFGYGMHHCLGAALARLEISGILIRLVREFPGLTLDADPESLPWDEGALLRRPVSLPVRW